MRIVIETIPHESQRYDTCGDWQFSDVLGKEELHITVSDTGDWREEACVAVHELVEALLCKSRGVSTEEVDAWDMGYKGKGEPGEDHKAPYFFEHQTASDIEFLLAWQLCLKKSEYESHLSQLQFKQEKAA